MEKYKMLINGELVESESGEYRPTINPANREEIALVPVATIGDTRRAIESARKTFDSGVWSGMNVKQRAKLLYKMVERLQERQDDLARIESMDSGATIRKTSMMDIPVGIEHFRALV
ncbi:MAG: aldehyde dehydrogenase family protein, partial [Myxococcota bacterium]